MPLTANRPSQELVDLVGTLGGTWHGNVAMCRCPAHADRSPSLSLRQGDRGILVTCFAGCDREDVLRELRRIPTGRHFPAPPLHRSARANFERIWNEAQPVDGTLAERYLERRNLLPIPPDVRFHPRCPYLPKPRTIFIPALLVGVRQSRKLAAIQRIFLDPESASYRATIRLGTPGHGAWRGGEGGTTLAIAEGFETARAFTLMHAIPCWASLGARRLDLLLLPSNTKTVLIAEDNDAEGRRAATKAFARYMREGFEVRRVPPSHQHDDWAKAHDAIASR